MRDFSAVKKNPCQEVWWLPCRSVNWESWDASLRSSPPAYVILKKPADWQRADLWVEPSLRVCTLREERVFSVIVAVFLRFQLSTEKPRSRSSLCVPACPCSLGRLAPALLCPLPCTHLRGCKITPNMTHQRRCWVSEAAPGGA